MDQLPSDVSIEALALSPAELKAFPRWYTDLLLRKRTDTVTIGDVLSFVDNFGISQGDKDSINKMFGAQLVTLDPPQFYVYLRLTGHVLQGKQVRRELAYVAAPVPKPRSILSKKGVQGVQPPKTEMDSFMSLMTGRGATQPQTGGVMKRKKRVTFDSKPPQITEAAHRSMSELLRQVQIHEQYNLPPIDPLSQPSAPESSTPNVDIEPDQPIANNQFAHVNIESVLHHGESMLPEPPAPRKNKAGDSFIMQLTQNSQPAQQQMGTRSTSQENSFLQPQSSGVGQTSRKEVHPVSGNTSYPSSQNQTNYLQHQSTGSRIPAPPPPRLQGQLTGQSNGTFLGLNSNMAPNNTGLEPTSTGLQPAIKDNQPTNAGNWPPVGSTNGSIAQQTPTVQRLGPQSTGALPMSLHPQFNQQNGIQPQLSGLSQFSPSPQRGISLQMANSPLPEFQSNSQPLVNQLTGQITGQMVSQPNGQQLGVSMTNSMFGGQQQPLQAQNTANYLFSGAEQPGMQFINSVQNPNSSPYSQNAYQSSNWQNSQYQHGLPNWQ